MTAKDLAARLDRIEGLLAESINGQWALADLMDDRRTAAWFARKCGLTLGAILNAITRAAWLTNEIPEFEAARSKGGRTTWECTAQAYRRWFTPERMAALKRRARHSKKNASPAL